MALTKVTGGLISTTSNYEVGVITATKFVGPIEGGVTGITTGSDKIKVIDESSDPTCFPLFATHSDGYLAAKSGSNLTFNSNNGTLTATTFSGALTGNVNGNATGLSGTPSIVVQDITAEMVSVAGTMQYEDVVNVDAVGIITCGENLDAQKQVLVGTGVSVKAGGLNVTAGVSTFSDDVNLQGANAGVTSAYWDKSANEFKFIDNTKLSFGTGQDLEIYHTGNHSILKNGTGNLILQDDNYVVLEKLDGTNMLVAAGGDSVDLYFDAANHSTPKLKTSATGITVTGEVAASQDYPNIRPTLDLNFASTKTLDPRITYSRTGPASYIDEFGIVKLVGPNTPRFDHDPTTRECKGFLIEESRTNDWVYSTDLSKITASGGFAGTQTYNTTTAPDGTTTADSHKGSGSSARHSVYWEPQQHTSAQLDNSSVYTCSVFVKQITGNSAERYCELETASHGTWSNPGNSPTFDLQNGTMDTSTASSGITGTIESYTDGWYRISMTSTTGTTNNDTGFYFNHTNDSSNSTQTLATTEGFHLWGAQIEKGSFITSYIPTSGSTATRGQGFAVIDGEELSDFYNPNTSTVICQFDASNWVTYNPNKYDRVWSFSNHNTETDTIEMFKQNSSNSQVRWRIRTSNTNVLGAANYTYSTTRPKLGFAWQLNDAGVSIDGATVAGTGDSNIPLPSITKLSLGNSGIENNNGGHGLTGWIRRFIYYPIKVSDEQLVTLTS